MMNSMENMHHPAYLFDWWQNTWMRKMMSDWCFGMPTASYTYIIDYDVPFRNGKAKLLHIPVNNTTTVNSHNSLSLRCLWVLSVSYPKIFLSVIGVSSSPSFQCEPAHKHCDSFCQEQGGSQNSSMGIHQ